MIISIEVNTHDEPSEYERGILLALAGRGPEVKVSTEVVAEPKKVAEAVTEQVTHASTHPEKDETTRPSQEEATAGKPKKDSAKSRRRRTKAQIEEDEANGLSERFKQLSAELPDASIEEIRERMYAEVAPAVEEAPVAEAPAEAPAAEDDWSAFEEAPQPGAPAPQPVAASPDEADEADEEEDDWAPNWL